MSLDPVTATIDTVGTIIDKIFPDADAAQKRDLTLALAQAKINEVEAGSTNWFVAGWRPFVGWVCGVSFAWAFLIGPVLKFMLAVYNHPVALPLTDTGTLVTTLFGMLGLGGLRTYEKKTGTEGNR